jgi:O-antigen/teichoic acid export membrane protein
VRRLWASPTIRSVVVYGAAGVGFAGANLILARVLPPAEYAVLTLVVALLNLGFSIAPAGVDGVVNRRHLEAGPRLLRQVMVPSTITGLVLAGIAALAYGTPPALTVMTLVSITAGGALIVASAQFQSEQRFGPSLALLQSTNLVLLLAALVTAAAGADDGRPAILVVTIGTVVCAVWGWTALFRERHGKPHRSAEIPWRDAFAYAGVQATGLLLIQLERLVLPHVLPLEELATYGVLAAVAGSLFRVLQMGVGYSLLPRLRQAPTVRQRRRLLLAEARLVGVIVLLGSIAIAAIVPLVERWFLAGKYHLTGSLVLATVVSGVAKIFNAFTKASAVAVAEQRELSVLNGIGWVSVAVAIVAAAFGARWGLAGVIYGVALGWALRSVASAYVTARRLRDPAPSPAAQSMTG